MGYNPRMHGRIRGVAARMALTLAGGLLLCVPAMAPAAAGPSDSVTMFSERGD